MERIKLVRRPNLTNKHPEIAHVFVVLLDGAQICQSFSQTWATTYARGERAEQAAKANVETLRAQKAVAA